MTIRRSHILFVLLSVSPSLTYTQQFKNLDFAGQCDTSKTGLCYWDLSWGKKGSVKPDQTDHRNALLINNEQSNAVGFAEQAIQLKHSSLLRILTATALIKSENIDGKGAGLNLSLYDSSDKLILSKDMGGFYSINWIRGSNPWKQYSISLVCPAATTRIKIGCILYGKGKAWFSSYKVDLIPIEGRKSSPLARRFINAVCDTIRLHSLIRDSIDISAIRPIALQIAGDAKKYADCYLAIDYLLGSLRSFGDEHSFFMTPAEVKNWKNEGSQVSKISFPKSRIMDSCGYILVPPFHGGNSKRMLAFADSLQNEIRILSRAGIKGWIIDLQENTGGNMEPMIAGLGPLFSSEKLGSLIDVDKKPNAWHYKNGRYYGDDDKGWNVSHPFSLHSNLPIAVLTSNQTGSSGEIVVVSFIGNANTRRFGQPTWGLTTGNGSFDLEDGSKLFLASTIMADRNGKEYTSSIVPDVEISSNNKEEVYKAAVRWIYSFRYFKKSTID